LLTEGGRPLRQRETASRSFWKVWDNIGATQNVTRNVPGEEGETFRKDLLKCRSAQREHREAEGGGKPEAAELKPKIKERKKEEGPLNISGRVHTGVKMTESRQQIGDLEVKQTRHERQQ